MRARPLPPFALLVVALTIAAGCNHDSAFRSNCTAGPPPAAAALPVGRNADGSAILPGGRLITPAGRLLAVGGYPIGVRVLPGGRYVVVTDDAEHDQALRVVDTQASDPQNAIVSAVDYPLTAGKHSPGLLYGLAVTKDGKRLYASNGGYDPVADSTPQSMHYNTVQAFDIAGTPPTLTPNDTATIELPFTTAGQRIPSGIVLSADETRLYVANQGDNTLSIVSLAPGASYGMELGRASLPGVGAYDVAVDEPSHTAFVSLWGGGPSGDGVVAVDVTNPAAPVAAPDVIPTGKAAEAELLVAGELYVSNADADTLSVVDAASRAVKTMPATSSMILGATPNAIAVEPAGAEGPGRIYVANAGTNSVEALDLDTLAPLGAVPTAWYPTAVALLGDGTLVVASARGLGTGPSDAMTTPPFSQGTLEVIARPSDADLQTGAAAVEANLQRPHTLEAPLSCAQNATPSFPLRAAPGAPSPIEHVFLVVRENKTYDVDLGDLAGGNGKADLALFGADVTPNAHALAQQFVLLDNFYSHAELSVQGHEWTTGCIANDYTEKSWSHSDDYGRAYLPAVPWGPPSTLSRLATPGSGSIWHHLDLAGVAYHNYGEIANTGDAMTQADPGYPGVFFNTNISDVEKAQYVVDNLNDKRLPLEPFTYLLLPNDHTNGTSPGAQTPASMIADNDEGTGVFIEGLSRSPWWKSSIVFVVEDDPAGGVDHVEQHRSLCLVASPWVKRGYHSSTHFDLGSVYHTIELILGVGPMNLNDGDAAAMYELFTTTPDFTPYTHIARTTPLAYNSADAPLANEAAKIDFSRPDQADLTRQLWKSVRGAASEPPGRATWSRRDDDDDDE